MSRVPKIKNVLAREVLDSRGFPTVEAELQIEHPKVAGEILSVSAMVPSGASTGEFEALELRDGDKKRYLGKGVQKAVKNIRERVAPTLIGREFARLTQLDDHLKELDGTANKANLGANSILAISLAYARALAATSDLPLHAQIATIFESQGCTLPTPLMNILNGGQHADNALDIQEFMIVPVNFDRFSEALRAGCEVFHQLKKLLHSRGLSTGVGDEGGFAPQLEGENSHKMTLDLIVQAISDAGYKPGKDIYLALDVASSELQQKTQSDSGEYLYTFEGKTLSSSELVQLYTQWVETYPIISIEDGLSEHDWEGWKKMTETLGPKCQLVGDDLFVTNPEFLKKGIHKKVGNSILIKVNQIGTLTETLETMKMAAQAGYSSVVSHRSGETEDSFIADLAVGTDAGQIKTGSLSRSDRLAKYNQLLRIEERLGERARYSGKLSFSCLNS